MNATIRLAAALLSAALLASAGVERAHAAILRVPGNFAFLENAVDAAAPGDTIQVAGNGGATYRSRFLITKPLVLQGGWRADFQVRNPSIYVSVIRSPQDAFEFDRPVIQVQSVSGVIIEGFAIVRGRVGIDATLSNVIIRDCEIQSQRNQTGASRASIVRAAASASAGERRRSSASPSATHSATSAVRPSRWSPEGR